MSVAPPVKIDGKGNFNRVVALKSVGMQNSEIAQELGIGERTVRYHLAQYSAKNKELAFFVDNKADYYDCLNEKLCGILDRAVDVFDTASFSSLSPEKQAGTLKNLSTCLGIINDKARLERGEATSIHEVFNRASAAACNLLEAEWRDTPG